MKYSKSIFIFRRDLRLADNHGLIEALENSQEVIPVFNFDPRQREKHSYFSSPGFQFLIKSLEVLDRDLINHGSRLHLLKGLPHQSILDYARETGVQAIYVNRDYTPFSIKRDAKIKSALRAEGIAFHEFDDALLLPPERGLKADGTPYTVFTPFFKRNAAFPPSPPRSLPRQRGSFSKLTAPRDMNLADMLDPGPELHARPGRLGALNILMSLEKFSDYENQRDFPAVAGTTRLSVHLKFGTLSVREAYHTAAEALGYDHPLIRQLFWRDFYTHIAFHFPHVFGSAFKRDYDQVRWVQDQEAFDAWKAGRTGFPIVDAGMRELLATGFMHNRVRMIVASFLTKDLLIDWRQGERFFAQHLLDYDPCVNNGNWQWSASTGCDAQPYFRIFNPWTQQKKFDPQAEYIKQWVPELREIPSNTIHKIFDQELPNYPRPIVDHQFARQRTLHAFGVLKGNSR